MAKSHEGLAIRFRRHDSLSFHLTEQFVLTIAEALVGQQCLHADAPIRLGAAMLSWRPREEPGP